MYLPLIKNARPVYRYRLGKHTGVVVNDCESFGHIRYNFVFYVLHPDTNDPIFAVASEKSSFTGKPMPFLGVFPGDRHENLGMSEDWADLDKFIAKALEIVTERFQLTSPPERLPLSNPRLN